VARLNKIAFKHYVDTGCDRRLLWDVAEADPDWLSPYRELVPPAFERRDAARLGHVWEQRVYKALRQLPGARAELDRADNVTSSRLDAADRCPRCDIGRVERWPLDAPTSPSPWDTS